MSNTNNSYKSMDYNSWAKTCVIYRVLRKHSTKILKVSTFWKKKKKNISTTFPFLTMEYNN